MSKKTQEIQSWHQQPESCLSWTDADVLICQFIFVNLEKTAEQYVQLSDNGEIVLNTLMSTHPISCLIIEKNNYTGECRVELIQI